MKVVTKRRSASILVYYLSPVGIAVLFTLIPLDSRGVIAAKARHIDDNTAATDTN